jgi:hypothetical protein
MRRSIPLSGAVIAALTLLIAGSACNLTLRTESAGTPQIIVVTATGRTENGDSPNSAAPSEESAPAFTPTLTLTSTITPTATTAHPTMTAGQDLSCVKGPHWILYGWVAKIDKGETVTLLAKAGPDWEEYYYVRKSDGTECWAFGGSSSKNGDLSVLEEREAPALPEIQYTIENKTGLPVVLVLIREKDSSDWGANRLSGPLLPGNSFSLTLTAGFYDVTIREVAAGTLYEKNDWPIGSEESYRTVILDTEFEFYIQNNFGFDLCTFSFRPAGGAWKVVHSAADGAIATGSRLTFKLLPAFYDVQINRCTGPMVVNAGGIYFGPAVPGYILP